MCVNLRNYNESAHLFFYFLCDQITFPVYTCACIGPIPHSLKPKCVYTFTCLRKCGDKCTPNEKQLNSAILIGSFLAHRAFSHSIHTDTQRICSLSSFTQHGFLIPISFKGLGKECKLPTTQMLFKVRNLWVAAMWIVRNVSVRRRT